MGNYKGIVHRKMKEPESEDINRIDLQRQIEKLNNNEFGKYKLIGTIRQIIFKKDKGKSIILFERRKRNFWCNTNPGIIKLSPGDCVKITYDIIKVDIHSQIWIRSIEKKLKKN